MSPAEELFKNDQAAANEAQRVELEKTAANAEKGDRWENLKKEAAKCGQEFAEELIQLKIDHWLIGARRIAQDADGIVEPMA